VVSRKNPHEKDFAQSSQFAQRVEHHAAAGPGIRAAGHFHHHDAADDEQSGNDAAFGQTAAQDQPAQAQNQQDRGGREGQTFLNDDLVTIPVLKDKLQQLQSDNPDLSVWSRAPMTWIIRNMIYVLDVLRQLDITKVGLATEAGATP